MYSIPYTGNPLEAMFLTTSKALSSQIMLKENIKTPLTCFPSQSAMLIPGKKYIIKPVWEDGSQGITAESVFTYIAGYEKNFEHKSDTHWIVQEYIDGREFNISILWSKNGPEVMPPAEMIFHNFGEEIPKIVDFRAKWLEDSFEYKNTIREFPHSNLETALRKRIEMIALKCWNVFGLRGYARVDLRIDRDGNPYVIEVNANPCISPDSGLVAAASEAGLPMTEVIHRIISDLNK
jgi:D-alanine-D-alanine ligase